MCVRTLSLSYLSDFIMHNIMLTVSAARQK